MIFKPHRSHLISSPIKLDVILNKNNRITNMPLGSYVLGFSGLGFLTRCWQLAIERRNVFDS